MQLSVYFVDAFVTGRPFTGNPAAVCPLDAWLADEIMQSIAAENNLSETAFFVPAGEGYDLRWFTPTTEVDLCGHATLASALVVFRFLAPQRQDVRFQTREAGVLTVARDGDLLAMDFPSRPPEALRGAVRFRRGARPRAPHAAGGARLSRGLRYRRRGRGAQARFCRDRRARPLRGDRHRAGRGWRRFRLALFRARERRAGRPGDRIGTLHLDPLLGRAARQDPARGAANIPPRRRAQLHP